MKSATGENGCLIGRNPPSALITRPMLEASSRAWYDPSV